MGDRDLLGRIGRLVSGMAHAAIGSLERQNQIAIVEEIVRELDGEAEGVRVALGEAKARKHRQDAHVAELATERQALDARIDSALAQGREDLAAAGVARQIDLDTLIEAAAQDIAAANAEIESLQASLRVITAGRRDAVSKLDLLRRPIAPGEGSGGIRAPSDAVGAGGRAEDRALRALEEIARVTGLADAPRTGEAAQRLDELERLHKDRLVAERLAAIKARRADGRSETNAG